MHFLIFCLCTIFVSLFLFEKNNYSSGFSSENQPQIHPFSGWVYLSLGGEC